MIIYRFRIFCILIRPATAMIDTKMVTLNIAFPFSLRGGKPFAHGGEEKVGDEIFESATREILKPS